MFDWTQKYANWTPEQQQQANAFLTPNIQTGNWQGIYDKAQQLGVSGNSLVGALNATGWTPDAAQWIQTEAYKTNPGLPGVLDAMKASTPFSVSDINAYTRGTGQAGFSDIQNQRQAPQLDPLAAGMRGLSPDQRFNFSQSIGLTPGTNSINRYLRQNGMLGGNRRSGGLLGMYQPQNPYPMTQFAPQFDWQQLGGLLGRSAFGG